MGETESQTYSKDVLGGSHVNQVAFQRFSLDFLLSTVLINKADHSQCGLAPASLISIQDLPAYTSPTSPPPCTPDTHLLSDPHFLFRTPSIKGQFLAEALFDP